MPKASSGVIHDRSILITRESLKGSELDRGAAFIPVAHLPYEFFSVLYGRGSSSKKLAVLDKKLKKDGWKREEPDYVERRRLGVPSEIEHKYLTVFYDPV